MSKMKASVFEEGADSEALTLLGASSEGAGEGKSLRSRKPSTRFALVKWELDGQLSIESKKDLRNFYWEKGRVTVLCDDKPHAVLVKMYELANEKG